MRIDQSVRQAREAKGLTQGVLAEKAGLHRVTISRIERGHQVCGVATLRKLARALSVSVSTLLPPEEKKQRRRRRASPAA